MIRQLFNMDRNKPFILACSGGVDSMAISLFYKLGNKNFSLAYFHHGTPQADAMYDCVKDFSNNNKIPFLSSKLNVEKPKDQSHEEFWRNERYKWLTSFNIPVITCHHLDDAVETWIFSSLHGTSKLIPHINGLIFRPFLLNTKEELKSFATKHNVKWIEDKSNQDVHFPRNRIRNNIIPEALKVNPGLHKVIKKKIILASQSKFDESRI